MNDNPGGTGRELVSNPQKAELTDIINKMKQGNPPATEGEIAKVIKDHKAKEPEVTNLDELPSKDPKAIGAWQNFKNNLSNSGEMGWDVVEFWDTTLTGGDEIEQRAEDGTLGAYSGLDIATTMVWEGVFGREKMKEWKEENPNFFSSFNPSDSETFTKVIDAFAEEKEETKETMTFKEADSLGDYVSVATGAVVNVGGSVVYNLGTLGAGFFMEFASDNFIEANTINAEKKGVELEELLQTGDFDIATPVKIAAVQAGLELFSLSKMTKPFGKNVVSELGKSLTKKIAYNKTARIGLDILGTGSTEAVTEMTQYGLEYYNAEVARDENVNMAYTIGEGMFSEQGVEQGLQGLFGGSGLRASARGGKTLSQIRKSSDDLDVESDLKNLVKLRRKFNESKDEDVKAGLEEKILNLEINVNDKIKKGNQIYDKLDQASMSEIEDLGSLADIAAARATELNKKLAKGQISKKDHAIALEGLTEKFTKNRAKIQATINKATGADNGTTKKSAGAGKEGVTDKVFESNLEFAKKHSSLYGLEVDDSLTVDQIREQHGEEAAASDGFIVGDKIIINKTVARATGAVNVGNHELLHGILRKALKNKDISKTVISELKAEVGSQWSAVERRAALYTPEYMEANPDEWITLASDAIQNGDITYNESVFERIGNVIKPILRAAGFKKIKFDTGKDVYSFLKEYNRSIHNGALATDIVKATQEADKDSFKEIQKRGKAQEAAARKDGIKKSLTPDQKKAAVNVKESTRKIVAKNEQIYQRIVDAAKAKGVKVSKDLVTQEMKDELVENNLARASALSNKAARVARNLTLDEGLKIDDASDWFQEYSLKLAELANTWDPSKNDSFGAYMNQLLPKKYSGILEGLKSDLETSSMDTNEGTRAKAEAIAVEDDAAPRSDTRRKKTNVLKIGNIEGKADTIKDAVEVNEGDTFKEVSDNNTGKVAEIIFDVPADKITDPKKNLTYAKRIVDGIPEPSEAGNIQSFYIAPQTVEKLLKILPEESVSSDTADINEIGENIDVDREVLGRGLGLSNRVLNSFYEKTNKRSKGKKSQPFIWKLKPEFKNPTAETIAKVQEDLGITPRGKLNNYNRDIGQLLKGVAKFQAQQTALSTAQRILTEQKAPKKQIASVTAAQSKVAFSKSPLEYSLELKRVAALTPAALLKDLDRSNHATFIREPYISKTTGKLKQRKVADFAREMRVNGVLSDLGKQTMEVLVTFAENYPQYLSDLRTTMSGGQGISFFGLTSVFDKMAAGLKSTSKTFKRSLGGYSVTGSKKLNANKVFKKDGKLVLKEGRKLLSEQTFAEQESKKLDALELFFMHVQQHLKKYPDHAWFFARLITDTGSNMSALTRVAAPVRAFPMTLQKVWDLMYSEVIIEEHSFPQNNVGTMLLNAAIKGESIKDVMKVVRGAYMQMALLETHDNQVTAAGYKFKMPDVFWNEIAPRLKEGSLKIKNGLASVVRYTESGIDLNNYYVPGEGQSITEYFGVGRYNNASETLVNKQNELITKQLTGEITKKEATSIINDFVKVEAIIESSKNRSTEVIDKAFKASRSSTKKLIDGLAENDISDAVSGVNPDGYSDIRFSKSHRAEYEKRLLKKNADIGTAKEAAAHIDALFNWVDSSEVPAKKKSKFEKLALHYMANNKLRMPEDGYKVIEAERLAEAKKIDPFSFKNPNDIIEKYSGEVTKKNPNPDQHLKENDNIGAFSNKREIGNGITVYDVKNGYPGMFATRNMVNEHFGKKSNPWCITQAVDGEITPTAKEYWDQYGTKQILFKDGKLLAMRTESIEGALTDAGDIEFWSRENVRFNEIPGNNYVDKQGRTVRSSFNEKTGEDSGVVYGATKGSVESGKLEIYDTYTSEGYYHPQKARYLGDGVKVQLYLDQVERYNKKGQLHGTQEQHTNPVSLEREGYASSITLTKEYKNGEFIGSRTDYGDGQGLGSFEEKLRTFTDMEGDPVHVMFSKSSKGITVLDFDDTLATTKSGVKARIPNPDGTPKPGRKVIFMAGGAGSGKGNVISKLGLKEAGYKIVNSDISLEWLKKNHGLPENQTDYTAEQRSQLSKLSAEARVIAKRKQGKYAGNGDGVVVDGTGGSVKAMGKLVQEFKDKGYDVSMVFVETSLEVAQDRNKKRKSRSLREGILNKNHEQVQGNKDAFKDMFKGNFNEVSTDNIGINDDLPMAFKNGVDKFTSSYENRRLDAEEFARDGAEIKEMGGEFDFSEFDKVVDGKTAPLFEKAMKLSGKFGTANMFILTARSPNSATAIKEFLDAQGLKIPLKNITGLGQSEASAKANWIAEKVGEGYNDFYFADDAMPNVKAVKDMLDQFDVKGKVQQAKVKFSKSGPKTMSDILDSNFNTILEETKGIGKNKSFSAAKARQRGKHKGKFKFFVPPSADDFAGLMYSFMGKGKQGDKHHAWFKEHLFDPFSKGIRRLNIVKQTAASDMKALRKAMPEVKKKLNKKVPGTEYTYEDAIRIYNWDKAGFDIDGLSNADRSSLIKAVESDTQLQAFAQAINSISEAPGGMVEPGKHWLGGNLALDLKEALDQARSTHLQQWKDNADTIFNEANLNKIEAVFGSNFREALEDSLWRMEHGGNRSHGGGRLLNNFTNWIHGSIGTTMFLNARSAMLQMISNVNFVNWSDNNMIKAAAAFGNQPQYWKDVAMIFNSPFLKQRRAGIQTDVNAAELLAQIKDSKNQVKAATAYLLQLGFTPTQIADSFAIATGGATFYRNRTKTYLKEGMTQADAETKAFEDMMEIAEETQQSTREDKISQQQASPLGKFILAFQNTPMQYNRLIKKAAQDLVNGRGDPKANISRIVYYGGIQNLIFYGLQSALFAALFSDDEEDQITDKKKERVMNGMLDTLLRGSGIGGAVVATVKNVILTFLKEEAKETDDDFWTEAEHANTLIEALNISPPIGIKARKLYGASLTWDYNRDVIKHMSKTDIDNPVYDAVSSATQALTNLPLNRIYSKYQNISEALNSDHATWKRVAMFLGWSKWNFGIKNQDVVTAAGEAKIIKAEDKKNEASKAFVEDQEEERDKGKKDIKCAAATRSGNRCGKKVLSGGNYCTIHVSVPTRSDGKKTQCSHVKSGGKRCKMQTTNQSGKCYYHD